MGFERFFESLDRYRSRRLERRMREELQMHRDSRMQESLAAGLTPDAAREAAARRIGDTDQAVRDGVALVVAQGGACRAWLIDLDHDFRDVRRALTRRAGFAASAVAIIAIAVAATATVWTVAHAALFRRLPFDAPDRLVRLGERHDDMPESVVASFRSYAAWRDRGRTLAAVAATRPQEFSLEQTGDPLRISGARVSASYFDVMGVPPIAGRVFTREEDLAGAASVLVIGEGLWGRVYGRDPAVIGRTVRLDGVLRTIVGVMPRREPLPSLGWDDLFVPLGLDEADALASDSRWLLVTGRLRPGIPIEQARADVDVIQEDLRRSWPDSHRAWTSTTQSLQEWLTGRTRPVVRVLLIVTGLVLATCAFSLAALLLVNVSERRRELAVRAALGAADVRLLRLSAVQGAVLGAAGGALGLVLARLAVAEAARMSTVVQMPRLASAALSIEAALAVFLGAMAGTVLIQLLVAASSGMGRQHLAGVSRTREGTMPRGARRMHRGLSVAQLAFALFVVVAAVSLARSLDRVRHIDPGFSTNGVLTFQLSLPAARYPHDGARLTFARRVLARLERLPGVTHTAIAGHLPLGLTRGRTGIQVPGLDRPEGQAPIVQYNVVSEQYFDALGIPVVNGRRFTAAEAWQRAAGVVLVNETLARRFLRAAPTEQRIRLAGSETMFRVVGVVGDVRRETLEAQPDAEIFLPPSADLPSTLSVVVHTAGEPVTLSAAVRHAVQEEDALLPVVNLMTEQQVIARAVAPRRMQTFAVISLAGVTLLLAVLGVYDLIARAVASRLREFAIRAAMGASRIDVLGMVLRETLVIVALSMGVGTALLLVGRPGLSSVLYATDPFDPVTLGGSAAILGSMALMAALGPARRAARCDSTALLRHDG